jgi:aminodeoxyfutalosine deaminase
MTLFHAAMLLPMTGPPIPDGMVRVEHGVITAVGSDLPQRAEETRHEFPDGLLMPGLLNCHTHLDLSVVRGPLPGPDDYVSWLEAIAPLREATSDTQLADGITAIVPQLLASGTTTVGDYVGDLRALTTLGTLPIGGRLFCEVIGNTPERARARCRAMARATHDVDRDRWRWSLTPHAPYTLHPEMLTALLTRDNRTPHAPLAIHVAESQAEVDYFHSHTGPLAQFLGQWHFISPTAATTPVQFLASHGGLPPRGLLIHANYLTAADIARIQAARCTIVHCPQSHAYFGHRPLPYAQLQAAGIRVVLGTDGLPCAKTLNLLTELALMREKHPTVPREALVAMVTRQAADALWMPDRGRIAQGLRADFAVFPWHTGEDPYAAVLAATQTSHVFIQGERIWPSTHSTTP